MFSAPNHVNFLLTHRCNLQCRYCYVPFKSFSEVGTDKILDIVDILYERGVFSLDLTGGEPLLRKDITEILNHCNGLDMDVGLATNGTLLTRERVEELARVWDRQRTVHVSVDASTSEQFERMTGSKDFLKVLECTKALLDFNLDVFWNFVYTPQNRDDLASVCKLACEIGVSKLFVLPVIGVGRGVDTQISFQELQKFLVGFHELEKEFPLIRYRVTAATPLDFLVPLLEAGWDIEEIVRRYPYARTPLQDEKFRDMRDIGCIGGVGRWAVTAEGDVVPCELVATDQKMRCGNILRDSFEECVKWCGSVFDVKLEEIEGCGSCRYGELCGGGCRARAYGRYGSVYARDPLCPFQTEECHRSERIQEREKRVVECGWRAFSVSVGAVTMRVRKESFGGTIYVRGREQQIYVNEDGYTIFEILRDKKVVKDVREELERRDISIDEESVENFLNQLTDL